MAVKKRPKALASGRPPVSRPKERMTAQRSRTIIRTHHRLHKELAAARKSGNMEKTEQLEEAIEENGGITTYQAASKQGQANDRGGDSSKVLVKWLKQGRLIGSKAMSPTSRGEAKLRCLEVGSLSIDNEISRFPDIIEMTRIDLNSQGPGIAKQDFMERPLPTCYEQQFDLISLSLVLNYVPDAAGRGEMLKRADTFLRNKEMNKESTITPLMFIVLPLPCVDNSRYLDEERLVAIMKSLGYLVEYKKWTKKLCYYLFSGYTRHSAPRPSNSYEKKLIHDGPGMNNFCITLEARGAPISKGQI